MSANCWTVCPNCKANAEQKHEKDKARAAASYGKVSAAEYQEMLDGLNYDPNDMQETLREDYEQGVRGGSYSVSYRCSCSTCGWSFGYKHQQAVPLKARRPT